MSTSANGAAPTRGVSPLVLVLSIALAVAVTAAVVLALRSPPAPVAGTPGTPGSNGTTNTPSSETGSGELFVQKDTVSPKSEMKGAVYYPIPFATTPNLKVSQNKREYKILEETEYGFSWLATPLVEDFIEVQSPKALEEKLAERVGFEILGNLLNLKKKPNLIFEDFTWEAKGVRGKPKPRPLTDRGSFQTLPNADGEVTFSVQYAFPPKVELSGNSHTTITEVRVGGFKWKNVTAKGDEFFGKGSVTWYSTGIPAGEGK
jgi:hypothetical protein